MNVPTLGMTTQLGQAIPLKGVDVEVELAGLLAHTTLIQRYRNDRSEAIEAVYAFPLPVGAVLLGLEIDIAGKHLDGRVHAKPAAEREYEEAVIQGHGAFLLRRLDDGLHQISLGNILPGEEVAVSLRWAELLRWSDNQLRYRLPTVVAPHYGDPVSAGIAGMDVPRVGFFAAYPLTLKAILHGSLAQADIACPTHDMDITRDGAESTLALRHGARLDRDFILQVRSDRLAPWEVWVAPDENEKGWATVGCLNVPAVRQESQASQDFTLIVDCSGSMAGDSITQVRRAMLAILDELQTGDTLQVLRFGSQTEPWFSEPVRIGPETLAGLRTPISGLQADMGGTEIMAALRRGIALSRHGADILLITDGEAYVADQELRALAAHGHRFFTVGVGSAVSEKILRTLADASHGHCELVTPNEAMADNIVAHFRRMRSIRSRLSVDWPAPVTAQAPLPEAVFAGDTAAIMACLSNQPEGECQAGLHAETGFQLYGVRPNQAQGALAKALPRLVAHARLAGLEGNEATELAVRYQLVTADTAMVAVLARAEGERTDGMPTLAEIPQMLAASWGGMGTVELGLESEACMDVCMFVADHDESAAFRCAQAAPPIMHAPTKAATPQAIAETPLRLLEVLLERIYSTQGIVIRNPTDFRRMAGNSLPREIMETLEQLCVEQLGDPNQGQHFQMIVLAFLDYLFDLLDHSAQRRLRPLRQLIVEGMAALSIPETIHRRVREYFGQIGATSWFEGEVI